MCTVLMLLIREFVYQKARAQYINKYKVELEEVFRYCIYMKDMQKDIPNILHACTCCGVYIWFSTAQKC